VVPATISVALLIFGVQEPRGMKPRTHEGWPIRTADLKRMSGAYWRVVGIGVLFTLARFSEAFLILKGQKAGLPLALVPLVMVVMNVVYAVISTPAGVLSDQIGRRKVLVAGALALVAADLVLGFTSGLVGLFVGVSLWGLYMGLSQGLLSALVGDTAPADLRGTAFGIFNLLTGIALLGASTLAGILWDCFGSTATFAVGAGIAAVAALALAFSSDGTNVPSS
jgi:MFS family permease